MILPRLQATLNNLHQGLINHYPPCCTLHFIIDVLRGQSPCKQRRKIILEHQDKTWVPCLLHSHTNQAVTSIKQNGELVDLTPYLRKNKK